MKKIRTTHELRKFKNKKTHNFFFIGLQNKKMRTPSLVPATLFSLPLPSPSLSDQSQASLLADMGMEEGEGDNTLKPLVQATLWIKHNSSYNSDNSP
jgi:hypothetical protein